MTEQNIIINIESFKDISIKDAVLPEDKKGELLKFVETCKWSDPIKINLNGLPSAHVRALFARNLSYLLRSKGFYVSVTLDCNLMVCSEQNKVYMDYRNEPILQFIFGIIYKIKKIISMKFYSAIIFLGI